MSYVKEVADLFSARFRGSAVLSPADYTLIAEWEKQEIPLSIVLECIRKEDTENVEIESIGYFQETVKKNFREWMQGQRT